MSQPQDGCHQHMCRKCGLVWEHEDVPPDVSIPAGYHTCPACGDEYNANRYYGPSEPEIFKTMKEYDADAIGPKAQG